MPFTDFRVMNLNAAGCPPEGRCQDTVTGPRMGSGKISTLPRQVDLPGHAWPRVAEASRTAPATADSTAGTRPRDAADGMRAWAVRECQLPRGGLQHPEAACRLEQDPGGRP